MKIFSVTDNDINCCHDTLKIALVPMFIDQNCTHLRFEDGTIYTVDIVSNLDNSDDNPIIYLDEEVSSD